MYKAANNQVPTYISELMPHLTRNISQYQLRNSDNIDIPFARTELSRRSCIPSYIALWNSLDQNFRTSVTLNGFKNKFKNSYNANTVPPFYLVGDRVLTYACYD